MKNVFLFALGLAIPAALSLPGCGGSDDEPEDTGTGAGGTAGSGGSTAGSGGSAAGAGGGTAGKGGTAGSGGGTAGSGGSTAGAGGSAAGAGGSAAGAGGSAAGAGGSAAGAGGSVAKSGYGSVSVGTGKSPAPSYFGSAGFLKVTPSSGSCTSSGDATCTITECPMTGAAGAAGAPTYPTAGAIQITGGADPLSLSPNATGAYTAATGTKLLFQGGETLSISAKGADVPAFNGSIVAPSVVDLLTPTVPAVGQPLSVDGSKAFPLTWSSGATGKVTFTINAYTANPYVIVSCAFPASAGSGEIPAATMAKLPKGMASWAAQNLAQSTVAASADWDVQLIATAQLGSGLATVK